LLAWVSMAAMLTEGVIGLWQGLAVGSIALTGWALGSLPEALASAMVAWRFSGSRTLSGMALTATSLLLMPILGRAKHVLAVRLGSAATAGEGTQNYLCGAQAAAVLVGLGVTASWPGFWWFDPVIGLGIAAAAIWQGLKSWRGEDCGC